jgi:hypothetical protein
MILLMSIMRKLKKLELFDENYYELDDDDF